MTKSLTATFTATVLGMTYYGASAQASLMSSVLDTHHTATLVRACLAMVIGVCCFTGIARYQVFKYALLGIGLGLMYVGVAGLLTSQLLSNFYYYVLPMDSFFAIEGGVISLIIGLETRTAAKGNIRKAVKPAPTWSARAV